MAATVVSAPRVIKDFQEREVLQARKASEARSASKEARVSKATKGSRASPARMATSALPATEVRKVFLSRSQPPARLPLPGLRLPPTIEPYKVFYS